MLDFTFVREGANVSGVYYNRTTTLAGGVVNQEVDLGAVLTALGRQASVGPAARYLCISTDVAISVRLNDTGNDAIAVSSTVPLAVPLNVLAVRKVYLSHSGACGAGAASVRIFAA